MKPKGFYYTRWKPELSGTGLSELLYAGAPKPESGTAIGLFRLLQLRYSQPVPVCMNPAVGAPPITQPAEVNSATEGERAQERRAWLLAKLGGEYSVFELSKTGKISYGGLDSWLDGKITNQTPTMRGKLVKALKKIGISCSISEVPQ
jgi:hypothetical protein